MILLQAKSLSIAFGHHTLLDDTQMTLHTNERICIVGRNGEGKSTLLKLIAQMMAPDSGTIEYHQTTNIQYLEQTLPHTKTDTTTYQFLVQGLGEAGQLLEQYHTLSQNIDSSDTHALNQLQALQEQLDQQNAWHIDQTVQTVLSKFKFSGEELINNLSGGWKRRVALAKALISEPNVLLLDEPTNHLDLEMIQWLQEFLRQFNGSLIFVSHDRAFIDAVATHIIELDRGTLTKFTGDYQNYLKEKAALLESEERNNALFDKKLAQEETWIRQGIKARRTRNEGRVRALHAMREKRAHRRTRQGTAKLKISEAEHSGKLVAELNQINYSIQDKTLVKDFSATFLKGDRVGIVGPNGIGKTTLIQLIIGNLTPDSGKTRLGTKLEIAYFDQKREKLDLNKSVIDTISDGQSMLTVGGKSKHAISYLKDFLFSPERSLSPVKSLSGGERNRLLLAKLFLKPSNCLILDEPTNDLDIETLELLEEKLSQYQGTIFLVSHDRMFIDNVVTSCLLFEGEGKISEHVGGYKDIKFPTPQAVKQTKKAKPSNTKKQNHDTLTFDERKELKKLPNQIERLEEQLSDIEKNMANPQFYEKSEEEIKRTVSEHENTKKKLNEYYQRWEELENKSQ